VYNSLKAQTAAVSGFDTKTEKESVVDGAGALEEPAKPRVIELNTSIVDQVSN
jgi:hypothetical protein